MTNRPPDDLIIARATPPGAGAVAIVRVDGAGAAELTEKLFEPASPGEGARDANGKLLLGPAARPRVMVFGVWRDPATGEQIDEGLTVFFRGPHSYTGNDLAEFQCHGGPEVARQLLAAGMALGTRLAEPGEFTRRAYLNGRLDLAQAEAVADLINAQTAAAARLANRQLAGALTGQINAAREGLITLAAEIEARIDFPEEDLGGADRARLEQAFAAMLAALEALLATRRRGRLLREGARVALVGRPNAGKSSLFNALARAERAIVTPHPGTTRDTIECTLDFGGFPVTLIDTAGLRASRDPIEQLGIARAMDEIERADIVILVRDAADDDSEKNGAGAAPARPPDLIAVNKIDLLPDGPSCGMQGEAPAAAHEEAGNEIFTSVVSGAGIGELEARVIALLQGGDPAEAPGEVSEFAINLRHGELLDQALAALGSARAAFQAGRSGEFIMIDLREALDALGAILGLELGDAILDRVFSQFCIGK